MTFHTESQAKLTWFNNIAHLYHLNYNSLLKPDFKCTLIVEEPREYISFRIVEFTPLSDESVRSTLMETGMMIIEC